MSFTVRVFCLGPVSDELKDALKAKYGRIQVTELPWDPDGADAPLDQAARLFRAYEEAGGHGMSLGDRILCVPRSLAVLVFFLELAQRGDWGTPRILISDDPVTDGESLQVVAPDAALLPLRRLRSGQDD